MVWTTNGKRWATSLLTPNTAPQSTSTSNVSYGIIEMTNWEGVTCYFYSPATATGSTYSDSLTRTGLTGTSTASYGVQNISYAGNDVSIETSGSYSYSYLRVYVGTGNTTPSSSDYALTFPTDSLTIQLTRDMRTTQDDYSISFTLSLQNTSSNDITIREIGLGQTGSNNSGYRPYASYNSNTRVTYTTLLYSSALLFTRDLLSTPLVIPAGETRSLTYRIDFSDIFS